MAEFPLVSTLLAVRISPGLHSLDLISEYPRDGKGAQDICWSLKNRRDRLVCTSLPRDRLDSGESWSIIFDLPIWVVMWGSNLIPTGVSVVMRCNQIILYQQVSSSRIITCDQYDTGLPLPTCVQNCLAVNMCLMARPWNVPLIHMCYQFDYSQAKKSVYAGSPNVWWKKTKLLCLILYYHQIDQSKY